jgi:pyruvate,water dikinase
MKRLHRDAVVAYAEGMRRCWESCGSPLAREHIVQFVDGWVYARGPEMDAAAGARLGALVHHVGSVSAGGVHWYDAELKPVIVPLVKRLRKHPAPSRPLSVLVDHLADCIEGHAVLMGDLHWRLASSSLARPSGPTYDWPSTFAEITGRPESEASVLVGCVANEMGKTVKTLRKLARLAAADPELLKAVDAGDASALSPFREFDSAFKSLLRRHGHRTGNGWGSASNTFDAPTWNVAPQVPLRMIATYAHADLDAIDRKERSVLRARKRLEREVRRELSDDPDRLKRFEEELASAIYHSYLLEDHNDWLDQSACGVLRDAEHNVGVRLVADGVIDDPADVAHLSLAELRSLPADVRRLVVSRKEEYAAQAAREAPELLGDAPAESRPMFHDEGEGHVGDELRGIAASPGRYTGRARVFMPSPIPPDVRDGDILVAKDAGPDWTPVFAILGAVVLDVGAKWQHASVVAREFGIPAVTGTVCGTSVITDGATITVDGDAGVVLLAP